MNRLAFCCCFVTQAHILLRTNAICIHILTVKLCDLMSRVSLVLAGNGFFPCGLGAFEGSRRKSSPSGEYKYM